MMSSPFISSSENAIVINLEYVEIEEIVGKKLRWFLSQNLIAGDILRQFYNPVEQVIIEFGLSFCKCNQLKSARTLGINRNTLRKKIKEYQLDLKELLHQPLYKRSYYPENKIFLSTVSSLSLTSACRAKLAVFYSKVPFPSEKALRSIGRPVEQLIIKKVLEYCKGNRMQAARLLGVNRNTLKKKLDCKKKPEEELLLGD